MSLQKPELGRVRRDMSILNAEDRRQLERDGLMAIEDGAFVVQRAEVFERVRLLIEGGRTDNSRATGFTRRAPRASDRTDLNHFH
jgi:hypothetical protein